MPPFSFAPGLGQTKPPPAGPGGFCFISGVARPYSERVGGAGTSGSTLLIVSLSQTVARVEIFIIAVLPQTGQRNRNASGVARRAVAMCIGMLHWLALSFPNDAGAF